MRGKHDTGAWSSNSEQLEARFIPDMLFSVISVHVDCSLKAVWLPLQECLCLTSMWNWKKSEDINRNWRKTRRRKSRKRRRGVNTIAITPCTQRVRRTLLQLTTSISSQRRCQRSVVVVGGQSCGVYLCALLERIFPRSCQPVCIVAVQELWFLVSCLGSDWLRWSSAVLCSRRSDCLCAQKDKNCHWSYLKNPKPNETNNMHLCCKSNTVQIVTSFVMLCCFTLTLTCCLVSRFAADCN